MTFSELSPIIQSWIDSDEFIDSLVSVVKEFNLPSSAPLADSIINLVLKIIAPEEFKAKLLSSLPPDKQHEGLVTRLVNLSLLPIKSPLTALGIDISVIAPLDETHTVPYNPDAKLTEEQDDTVEDLPVESIDASPLSDKDEVEALPATEQTNITETNSALIVDTPPIGALISPVVPAPIPIEQSLPAPDESAPLTPNFGTNTKPLLSPLIEKSAPAPFIIHKEQSMPQASINSHKESLIRPMFYSGAQEIKGNTPIASIDFGETQDSKKINPANIVDLTQPRLDR